MKGFNILILLFSLALCLVSCEKDNQKDLNHEATDFIFEAQKDSGDWVATYTWGYFNNEEGRLTLSGAMRDSVYYQEEVLNLVIDETDIVPGEKLRDFDAAFSFVIGGDGIAWSYRKTEDITWSYLIINELDTFENRISGEFEIRLKQERSDEDRYINLKKGEFDFTYEDR